MSKKPECAVCGKPIHQAAEGPWVHDQPYNPWIPPIHAAKRADSAFL